MKMISFRRLTVAATVVTLLVGGVAKSAIADDDAGCSSPGDPSGGVVCRNVEVTQGMVNAISCWATGKGVWKPCDSDVQP